MPKSDQFRIHLSLVSHTNIGKTTLARTLLMKDVGEVADRAHVTENTEDYVLARDAAGCELVLWDTPGFGNSVALAKRLSGRSNPIGWFLAEVWDRMTNKAFWLNQRAIKHVKDISDVVLYLVNASDLPKTAPYITAEMEIISWINKPVIVLLNQMGKPRTHAEEREEVEAWRDAMKPYLFVKDVLPMDAFARCWVQETALLTRLAALYLLTNMRPLTHFAIFGLEVVVRSIYHRSMRLHAICGNFSKRMNSSQYRASKIMFDRSPTKLA